MGTSLSDQLRRLAVPQTSLLLQDKKRASLLFDPKEAANLDRETFYDLGVSGLTELKSLHPRFAEFEQTLFNLSSMSLERSVETRESNIKLDRHIKKFLLLLSPYFLLKPSHKALEWLINRFRIHEYNIDDLMMLILPYHETRLFVRVLQLMDIKDPSSRWHWLYPLQKPGVVLVKGVLLKRCSRDLALLKFISEMTLAAVKEYKTDANVLSTMFAFYCTALVGALEVSKSVTELQLMHLIKSLLRGLKSQVEEFRAAALMVTAQVTRKTQLSKELLFNIIKKISKSNDAVLSVERVTLLVLIYQNQDELHTQMPDEAILDLSQKSWFFTALGQVVSKGAHVIPFLKAILSSTLRIIQRRTEDQEQLQNFIHELLVNITLDLASAEVIIQCIMESLTFDLDDDQVQKWSKGLVGLLERQYPTAFDAVVKDAVMNSSTFAPLLPSHLHVVNQLHHSNSSVRVMALKELAETYAQLDVKERGMLAEGLKARLHDDVPEVVEALLRFETSALKSIMGSDNLHEQLVTLLAKCWQMNETWQAVAVSALPHLSFPSSGTLTIVDAQLFIAVFPYLLPSKKYGLKLVEKVLFSDFGRNNAFLMAMKKKLTSNLANETEVCKIVMDNLNANLLPPFHIIKEVVDTTPIEARTPIFVFVTSSLLTALLQNNIIPEVSDHLLESIVQSVRGCTLKMVKELTFSKYLEVIRHGCLPANCFVNWLLEFIKKTAVHSSMLDSTWWDLSEHEDLTHKRSALFLLKVFDIITAGCTGSKKMRDLYIYCLTTFFQCYFPTVPSQVVFLCKASIEGSAETRIRCLRLAGKLLRASSIPVDWALSQEQNIVVPTLIVAAHDKMHAVRVSALSILELLCASTGTLGSRLNARSYVHLVERLVERKEELTIDDDHISLALYTALSPDPTVQSVLNSSQQSSMKNCLESLLSCILEPKTPHLVCAKLLSALRLVTSPEILTQLTPWAKHLLAVGKATGQLDLHQTSVLRSVLERLSGAALSLTECWELFQSASMDHTTKLKWPDNKSTPPALLALDLITQEFFSKAEDQVQQKVLALILTAGTDTEQGDVVMATARAFKRVSLNASLAAKILEEMRDAKNPEPPGGKGRKLNRFTNVAPTVGLLETAPWRRGTTLLELLQGKKKLHSVQVLLPCLFDLLKKCLQFEEQAPVEYTKQLLLSLLLHCCQKLSEEGPLPAGVRFDAELVVECVRSTQNPQTHHHVLLLLSHIARLSPGTVLHNIMAVFTFMGSSVLRQDDAYSFQVITQIVDTVIPTLVQSAEWCEVSNAVCGVLRVFVDALLDIPEHRQLPLFDKLLTTLDAKNSLWILLCLVVESHVMHGGTEPGNKSSRRMEFAVNIAQKFSPEVVFTSCVHILEYILSLPADKDDSKNIMKKSPSSKATFAICGVTGLFDVERSTAKQLRHMKYAMTTYLSTLLVSPSFVAQVAILNEEETFVLESLYREMIENLLKYIGKVTREVDASSGKPTAKYWRVMLNQGYDILDKVNALLPCELFLAVTCGLLKHDLLPIQRKALELFNTRLQHQAAVFTSCDRNALFNAMPLLIGIIKTIQENEDDRTGTPNESELIQQTALLSVKLMARLLGTEEPQQFSQVLALVTKLAGSYQQPGPVLASILLCLAELCGSLRAHAIPSLAELVPPLITALKSHTGSADIMILSTVTAIDKVVEALPNFLSPYLTKLLYHVSVLSAMWQEQGENSKVAPIVGKLSAIRKKMSTCIPPRVLIPAVGKCYAKLLEHKEFTAVGSLLGVLSDSFSSISGPELVQIQPELMSVLSRGLDARFEIASAGLDTVTEVENHAVKTLVVFVLKLSESAFRPIYYSLFHWATELSTQADRAITFYKLSSTIAENLKGLFVLFAGHFLKNAAMLLDKVNTTKAGVSLFPDDNVEISEQKSILLLKYILQTLHSVFLYDSSGTFVNKERFETIMQPIVDQLENTLGCSKDIEERMNKLLTPCIAQLASASADDIMWKQLNYQVLLKARHNSPQVRLAALRTLCTVAGKLGEDFLPLLPETIPFLAELMEDEDEVVEKAAKEALQDLETVLGEPLQKYF